MNRHRWWLRLLRCFDHLHRFGDRRHWRCGLPLRLHSWHQGFCYRHCVRRPRNQYTRSVKALFPSICYSNLDLYETFKIATKFYHLFVEMHSGNNITKVVRHQSRLTYSLRSCLITSDFSFIHRIHIYSSINVYYLEVLAIAHWLTFKHINYWKINVIFVIMQKNLTKIVEKQRRHGTELFWYYLYIYR